MPDKKETLTYDDYVKGIQALKPEEQLNLIELLSLRLKKAVTKKTRNTVSLSSRDLELKFGKGLMCKNILGKRGSLGVNQHTSGLKSLY